MVHYGARLHADVHVPASLKCQQASETPSKSNVLACIAPHVLGSTDVFTRAAKTAATAALLLFQAMQSADQDAHLWSTFQQNSYSLHPYSSVPSYFKNRPFTVSAGLCAQSPVLFCSGDLNCWKKCTSCWFMAGSTNKPAVHLTEAVTNNVCTTESAALRPSCIVGSGLLCAAQPCSAADDGAAHGKKGQAVYMHACLRRFGCSVDKLVQPRHRWCTQSGTCKSVAALTRHTP